MKKYNFDLIVEKALENYRSEPMKVFEVKDKLTVNIPNEKLKKIISNLHSKGKIICGSKGVQWIYSEPEHLKKMIEGSLEV